MQSFENYFRRQGHTNSRIYNMVLVRKNSPHIFMHKRRGGCLKIMIWLAVFLFVSIDISTATWGPHQPPRGSSLSYSEFYHRNDNDTPRGGSSAISPPPQQVLPSFSVSSEETDKESYPTRHSHRHGEDHYHSEDHNYRNDIPHHSSSETSETNGYQDDQQGGSGTFFSSKINLNHVVQALLHTTEWNRRLRRGLKYWGTRLAQLPSPSFSQDHRRSVDYHVDVNNVDVNNNSLLHHQHYHQHQQQQQQQQNDQKLYYGNLPININPSRTWQPSIQASSNRAIEDEELSLFHAKTLELQTSAPACNPRTDDDIDTTDIGDTSDDEINDIESIDKLITQQKADDNDDAIQSWGPDLLPYLEFICEKLGIKKNGVELALAMVYMDRSISVETCRSNNIPSCPYCTPRTVHRLSLVALILSVQAVRGVEGQQYQQEQEQEQVRQIADSLGIPFLQLQHMIEWMRAALGDDGFFVAAEEMLKWNHSLESILSSSTLSG